MKKVIVVLIMMLSLFACSLVNTPSNVVEEYLNKYITLNDDVLTDMEKTILNEGLSTSNREIYKKVLLRTYENLKYEIKDESIDGNKAVVTAKIVVYDLHNSEIESLNYMNEHLDEFTDINYNFDNEYYNTYKLNQMLNTKDTVEYEIKFNLTKNDNEWVLNQLDRDSLEKIHGLYNYDNE